MELLHRTSETDKLDEGGWISWVRSEAFEGLGEGMCIHMEKMWPPCPLQRNCFRKLT